MEAGFRIQDSSADSVQAAVSSRQTAEYKKDWGLEAMGAANLDISSGLGAPISEAQLRIDLI